MQHVKESIAINEIQKHHVPSTAQVEVVFITINTISKDLIEDQLSDMEVVMSPCNETTSGFHSCFKTDDKSSGVIIVVIMQYAILPLEAPPLDTVGL